MLICVFTHSRFIENPSVGSLETNPCFFMGGLSQCSELGGVDMSETRGVRQAHRVGLELIVEKGHR
jgi:hypothetical protein